jgi:hypothetical protein
MLHDKYYFPERMVEKNGKTDVETYRPQHNREER